MNILSCCGGGCWGTAQAEVLAGLPSGVFSRIDAYAGTSIGAITAMAAATGQARELPRLFTDYASRIFEGYGWRSRRPWVAWSPRYSPAGIAATLKEFLPGSFGSLPYPVFIGAHDLRYGRPKVFYSRSLQDAEWAAWEVAQASAAAPTYFPPVRGMSDGGPFFNDPSMMAIAGVRREMGAELRHLRVFSLGTGENPIDRGPAFGPRWRAAWLPYLIEDMFEGGAVLKDRYYAEAILSPGNYRAYEFKSPAKLDMDNPQVVAWVRENWADQIAEARESLTSFFGT